MNGARRAGLDRDLARERLTAARGGGRPGDVTVLDPDGAGGEMRTLRLVGLSADGRSVVFVDDAGAEFAAPADERLLAALRNDRARLGQLEIEMESALRPRDIQARIRAGDSPEAVAAVAQVPVERIMPYCLPVLAEREHVADVARRSHVRRQQTDGPSRQLTDVVAERLRGRGIDPGSATWDAWRRDDGRWTIEVRYHSGESERAARFAFDAIGRYSTAEDDEAKWLTGERQQTRKGPMPRERGTGNQRRLSAVPNGDDLLSLGDEGSSDPSDSSDRSDLEADDDDFYADDLDDDEVSADAELMQDYDDVADGDSTTDDLTAVVRALQPRPAQEPDPVESVETWATGDTGATGDPGDADDLDDDEHAPVGSTASPDDADQAAGDATQSQGPGRRPQDAPTEPTPDRRRKQRRASVPSWDEIMFGRDDT